MESGNLVPCVSFRNQLIHFDQDVPCPRLLHRCHHHSTTLGRQFDKVKSVRAAQHRRDLANPQLDDDVGKNTRQPIKRPHTQTAALKPVGRIGVGRRELREILTCFQAAVNLIRFRFKTLDLLRTRRLGTAQQDMSDLVFFAGLIFCCLAAQEVIDLALGNDDLALHFTFAHSGNRHFRPAFLAKLPQ